jgi:thiol:disulfide interchange protein DsbD
MRGFLLFILVYFSLANFCFAVPSPQIAPPQSYAAQANKLSAEPLDITIVGEKTDPVAADLYKTAKKIAPANSKIIWWDQSSNQPSPHPEISYPKLDKAAAYLCMENNCSLPMMSTGDLEQSIQQMLTQQPLIKSALPANEQTTTEYMMLHGNIFYIIIGFWVLGLLIAFTPCVLPLILIMASFLGGRSGEISKAKMIFLALIYVVTLATTYAIAGICTALFGFYLQTELQKPWIYTLASIIFLFLALSMLDLYKLKLPKKLHLFFVKHNKYQSHYSFLQVAVMAILITLIASPCITAPLVAALSYIGTTGNIMLGGAALFAMGVGISTPLLIATIVGVHLIPKSEAFQTINRNFFGFALLGISIWLLTNVIPASMTMILWSMLGVYIGLYLYHLCDLSEKINLATKTLGIVVLTFGIAIFVGSLLGNQNPLRPLTTNPDYQLGRLEFINIKNTTDLQTAFTISTRKNKHILLFFSAPWCVSCTELKNNVFTDQNIVALGKEFMLLEVTISTSNPDTIKLIQQFNIVGAPAILFFDPKNNTLDKSLMGYVDADHLRMIMNNILHK